MKTLAVASTTLVLAGGAASASIVLAFGSNSNTTNAQLTGASGTATLDFSDDADGVLVKVTVENTTGDTIFGAGATASELTYFGFDLVDGASYFGGFVGGTYLDTLNVDTSASPFGTIDIGAGDDANFQGAGGQGGADGIPSTDPNTTDMFSFILSYTGGGATDLENAFYSAFTDDPVLLSVMRFQSVNAGEGSDKLSGPDVSQPGAPVPLPAAGWMLIAGIGGLVAMKRRKAANA
ncbi:VPLPA-CTERM sorting domain-containing protein [Roseicyclus salinarum]|uniref:VPLPA-CTERM sorting domain-containing protein n=1 Tax=Roseicyclus salinarum TaxID=3036773 RepID=UPI002414F8EA|nr:VPLPA-CTERM sorting domain-containing protein [Roseibacterium sp. SDUM158017]